MTAIEVLNAITEKRNNLLKIETKETDKVVSPDKYDENIIHFVNGRYFTVSKGQYIQNCIQDFLTATYANSQNDLLKGFEDANKVVNSKYGYGKTDDVFYKTKEKFLRIRYLAPGEELTLQEQVEIANLQNIGGKYLIIKSIEDFYKFYVNEFGEVEL